jgi:biotin-dependent carboxylase-like uncharacterized protein
VTRAGLRIVDPGRATTVQDRGRVGHADLGVPRAGAVDRDAHDLVNRLVGNDAAAASIETNGGLVVEALRPLIVATAGYRRTLGAGERFVIEGERERVWSYLAVRGGIDVGTVMGSRSHDTLAGIGPPGIDAGTELPVGVDPGTDLPVDHVPIRRPPEVIRLWPGPRADWLVDGLDSLLRRPWTVSASVSRVGVRLEAGEFTWALRRRLASEGLVEGAVQVTPSGEPIIMLANHPTTGGYPVVAVVEPADLVAVVQAPPGADLRFVAA